MFVFHYCLLGGDTAMPGGLYALPRISSLLLNCNDWRQASFEGNLNNYC